MSLNYIDVDTLKII